MNPYQSFIYFGQTISTILLPLLISACNEITSTQEKTIAFDQLTNESCIIATIQHKGSESSDRNITKYQQLLAKSPGNIGYWESLGWAYIEKAKQSFDPGFYKLAEQSVACMNGLKQDTLAAKLLHGHILHNLHRFKEAEAVARKLVESRGFWLDYGLLGDVLMEQGELDEAIDAYQNMIDQKPGPQSYNRIANLRWLRGDVEGAQEMLELSIAAYTGQMNQNSAWSFTRLADYKVQSGQIDQSMSLLSKLLAEQPDYAPGLLAHGRIAMALGRIEEAIVSLTQAEHLNPLPEYRWALIEALSVKGINPEQRLQLERELLQTGLTEDRRTYALYLAAHGIEPTKAVLYAAEELEQRHDSFTLDTYAWALWSDHQYDKAESFSAMALKEGTQSARLFYHAGAIAMAKGKTVQAQELLAQAKNQELSLLPSERKHLNQFLRL